jgi:signal transduction histidine kinase
VLRQDGRLSLEMDCSAMEERLPAEADLALYRILQNSLNNVERHAQAHHVTMHLTKPNGFVQLTVKDDGIGFDPDQTALGEEGQGLGLLRMRERAASVHGSLSVKSAPNAGTEMEMCIPLPTTVPQLPKRSSSKMSRGSDSAVALPLGLEY